jgi:hypothetical protein
MNDRRDESGVKGALLGSGKNWASPIAQSALRRKRKHWFPHRIGGKVCARRASHEGLMMANRVEECRRKAEQCEHAATVATNPEAQRTYRQLAQQWREMAIHFEAKEQRIAAQRQGALNGFGAGEPTD